MESFSWHSGSKGRYRFLLGIAAFCLLIWFCVGHDTERWMAWCFLAAVLLLGPMEGTTVVDPNDRRIVRHWKWMSRIPLWKREVNLDGFSAVTLRENLVRCAGDPVYLAMVRKNGRFFWVAYFWEKVAAGVTAGDAARRLSRATGLPLAYCPPDRFSRSVPVE